MLSAYLISNKRVIKRPSLQIHRYLNDILLAATKLGVKQFEAVPPTLEDLFLRHYEN